MRSKVRLGKSSRLARCPIRCQPQGKFVFGSLHPELTLATSRSVRTRLVTVCLILASCRTAMAPDESNKSEMVFRPSGWDVRCGVMEHSPTAPSVPPQSSLLSQSSKLLLYRLACRRTRVPVSVFLGLRLTGLSTQRDQSTAVPYWYREQRDQWASVRFN